MPFVFVIRFPRGCVKPAYIGPGMNPVTDRKAAKPCASPVTASTMRRNLALMIRGGGAPPGWGGVCPDRWQMEIQWRPDPKKPRKTMSKRLRSGGRIAIRSYTGFAPEE